MKAKYSLLLIPIILLCACQTVQEIYGRGTGAQMVIWGDTYVAYIEENVICVGEIVNVGDEEADGVRVSADIYNPADSLVSTAYQIYGETIQPWEINDFYISQIVPDFNAEDWRVIITVYWEE